MHMTPFSTHRHRRPPPTVHTHSPRGRLSSTPSHPCQTPIGSRVLMCDQPVPDPPHSASSGSSHLQSASTKSAALVWRASHSPYLHCAGRCVPPASGSAPESVSDPSHPSHTPTGRCVLGCVPLLHCVRGPGVASHLSPLHRALRLAGTLVRSPRSPLCPRRPARDATAWRELLNCCIRRRAVRHPGRPSGAGRPALKSVRVGCCAVCRPC